MLQKIKFLLPVENQESKSFFSTFKKIFQELPNAVETNDKITIRTINPSNAFPETLIEKSNNKSISIQFDSNSSVDKEINTVINRVFAFDKPGKKSNGRISITDFYDKLKGHITSIDHTGVNLPSIILEKDEWNILINKIAEKTTIYNYPTGENWPFILPATKDEFENDIRDFCVGREPKFELVYDEFNNIPTFQFDIETDLTQIEVENLFPAPIGESFEGLETYFRAVYVISSYSNIIIRFDTRFKNENVGDEWDTGKWLVEEGKRIIPKP